MSDYLDIIEKNRSGGIEHAATVPVFYEDARRGGLTPRRKRAKLSSSASVTKRAVRSKTKSSPSSSRKTPKMAKRKTSAKQKAAARRNIKKAQAAKRAKARARSAAGKKAARTRARTKSPRKAARRAAPKRAKSKRSKSKSKSKRSRKSPRRSRKRRARKTKRSMSMRVPRKTKKVYVVAAEKPRKRRSKRRGKRRAKRAEEHKRPRRSRGSSRRRGAMENPMTGVELFVGSITGLFGFGVADAVDRLLATHALTDKNAKDANGYELYADNPPTTGDYTGLFNATAICSPMDWKRWVFGLVGASVPLTIAHFVSAPTGRAALQFFGFGYGIRIVGKGLIDGLAALTVHTGTGQRLYDGEMRAAVLKSNNGNNQADALASLPSAGLGATKQLAAPCKDCGPAGAKQGAGYPSMPREVAPTNQPVQSKAPTPSGTYPNPPPPPPEGFNPGPLTGVPRNGVAAKKNPYLWGADAPNYKD